MVSQTCYIESSDTPYTLTDAGCILMQVKATLRSLPHAQAHLQEAEAACFGAQQLQLQQKAQTDVMGVVVIRYNTLALQALQMLLLLLDFQDE